MPNLFTLAISAIIRLVADLLAEAGIHSPLQCAGTTAALLGISVKPMLEPSHAMPIVGVNAHEGPSRRGKPGPKPAWIGAG